MARVKRSEIREAITEGKNFLLWKAQVISNRVPDLNYHDKMRYVVAGLHLGLLLATAISLCGVKEEEFKQWLEIDGNSELLQRASSFAEAQLEVTLHQAAIKNPYYAMAVLEKRNSKRWLPKELLPAPETAKRGKVLTMSEQLKDKQERLVNPEDTFDV